MGGAARRHEDPLGDPAAVLWVEHHAARAQEIELLSRAALIERAVGAGYDVPLGVEDERQRQHAAPPDAAKKISCPPPHRRTVQLQGVAPQGNRG